ncbi:hypothetical protein H2200_006311 [Cladophialophora chaetospira]|uniref:Dimethylaniline monooxygenase n=1 Tax=Cladophialophora chaetospira TaxID=386627 RepID=A0AA38XAX8_9EURO|nr:hypothetical protein H2200_006311 [Cladophialophora chaetospira]
MPATVAVVGVGPLGLMALKNLKEDGFAVTGFERRNWVGGVWKQSFDANLSTTANTVFNSSRFRSAIPDYPFPDDVDDFPTAKQLWKYFEDYCDHFELRPRIRFGADVKNFERKRGKWAVEYIQNGSLHTDYFDKLMIAPGSFVTPRSPKLEGVEAFQGKILHSLNFPDPSTFQGQNVLLVGFHATAQDLVVELAPHAKKVYIAHKNGLIMMSRYGEDGRTYDQAQNLTAVFVQLFLETWLPSVWNWLFEKILLSMSKKSYPNQRKEWNLSPAPPPTTTSPLIADAVYPHLESGFAEPVAAIQQITGPKTIQLKDGRVLNNIDTIIFATGYEAKISYAPDEYNPYPIADEAPFLYRNIFPLHPDASVRNSLAFLGQGGIPFPGFVQFELKIWAISQIWQGKASLPSFDTMQQWHKDHMAWRQEVVRKSKFDSKFIIVFLRLPDHLKWLDKTAGTGILTHFSWFSWRSWRFWWQDRRFYNLCKSGLISPAMWRLFDMGGRKAWAGAKEQIIKDNEFADKRQQERLRAMGKVEESRKDK